MSMIVRPHWMSGMLLIVGLSASLGGTVAAQRNSGGDDGCEGQNWGDDRSGFCEVRAIHGARLRCCSLGRCGAKRRHQRRGLTPSGRPRPRAGDRHWTDHRRSEGAGGAGAGDGDGRPVIAEGPRGLGQLQGWHVSYRLAVPTGTPLSLKTTNGGISVDGVDSHVEFTTVNGGVRLSRMAGEVQGRTSNGSAPTIRSSTAARAGGGLHARQDAAAGARLRIPENAAHLETGTGESWRQHRLPDYGAGAMAVRSAPTSAAAVRRFASAPPIGGVWVTRK